MRGEFEEYRGHANGGWGGSSGINFTAIHSGNKGGGGRGNMGLEKGSVAEREGCRRWRLHYA